MNPADDTSRGLTVEEVVENKRWLMGPAFLWKSSEYWPSQDQITSRIPGGDPELNDLSQKGVIQNKSSPIME